MKQQEFIELATMLRGFCVNVLLPIFRHVLQEGQEIVAEKPREGMGRELVGWLDREITPRYKQFVRECFPDYEIVSEEGENSWPPQTSKFWIFDECDGTHNILAGLPTFGTMGALIEGGQVVFSFVFLPANEIIQGNGFYAAARGCGAWQFSDPRERNVSDTPARIRVSGIENLADAFVLFEGPTKKILGSPLANALKSASRRHRYGVSSVWSGTLLASASAYPSGFDALIFCDNSPWDTLPISLLVEEAGGRVTDHGGNRVTLQNCRNVVMSNGSIHDSILALNR